MKPRTRALAARLAKLERGHLPVLTYVVRLSHEEWEMPTRDKQRLIAERSGGRPVMVSPEKCATVEEWVNRYAPH